MKVILPGSYDPVTLGHLDIIKRAAGEYDEVFVVAFVNPKKKYRFSVEDRVAMLMLATEELDNVLVSYSDGRVVDYMREHGIEKIVKGYRTEADLPWEREQAEYNKKHGGYETELWKCREGLENVSSTLAREKLSTGDDCENILPKPVIDYIKSQVK
ncbi:MAG: pantetheine-phosphate adenylyltransferase [Clostridia bacterium]|nr:pantetheine-phosphate adenylyltransferase [Clostridia bacterium]